MFKFFEFLKSSLCMMVDGGEGGALGDGLDELDIGEGGENKIAKEEESGKEPKTNPVSSFESKKIAELEKQLEENQKFIEEQQNIQAVNDAIVDIKKRVSGFDADAVYEHLKKLNESDPQKAMEYNNPIGWENIWYQIRPATSKSDNVSFGRNSKPVDRDEEVFELVKSGGASLKDEADVLGKLL